MKTETLTTKVTQLGKGVYGCRVINTNTNLPIVEARVKSKSEVSGAIKEMLRTLDKLGYNSPMASASRNRDNGMNQNNSKFIWF
jgi:hypothetical protein